MTRPLRIEVAAGFFHVTSRGIARKTIFRDDLDHHCFLSELRRTLKRTGWRCLSYCLMGNHFHLLVQTPKPNLSQGMRDLKSEYANGFNHRHGLDGSLFKARYWSQLIQEDAHLLTVGAYIAQNPVRAGLTDDAAAWPWSSYASTVAGTEDRFLDSRPLLELLSPDPRNARRKYAEVVSGSIATSFDPSAPIVGDSVFIDQHAPDERPTNSVSKRAWEQARPTLTELAMTHDGIEFIARARRTITTRSSRSPSISVAAPRPFGGG